jgi:glutamine amidotransferase
MNCNVPTDICFSFTGFQARGGRTDVHSDGWGIAFFEGKGVRQFLDPLPSSSSAVAQFVREYPIKSMNVIAHIRKATQGRMALENTHPFLRELWGRYWIFAHNGNLKEFAPELRGPFRPVGDTDSEQAFCYLLEDFRERFGDSAPAADALFDAVRTIAIELSARGEFNFLLSNGDFLFVHCSTQLHYIIRQAPFKTACLKDEDVSVNFEEVTTANDRVAVIATQPLTTNEEWTQMKPGSLWMFRDGAVVRSAETALSPPREPKTSPT